MTKAPLTTPKQIDKAWAEHDPSRLRVPIGPEANRPPDIMLRKASQQTPDTNTEPSSQ
jgi:hypothetical protein